MKPSIALTSGPSCSDSGKEYICAVAFGSLTLSSHHGILWTELTKVLTPLRKRKRCLIFRDID
eukprot:scaffold136843_cov39-Prasinocladus_malaysianus.AAC.1